VGHWIGLLLIAGAITRRRKLPRQLIH
jgi:hypothetical protein